MVPGQPGVSRVGTAERSFYPDRSSATDDVGRKSIPSKPDLGKTQFSKSPRMNLSLSDKISEREMLAKTARDLGRSIRRLDNINATVKHLNKPQILVDEPSDEDTRIKLNQTQNEQYESNKLSPYPGGIRTTNRLKQVPAIDDSDYQKPANLDIAILEDLSDDPSVQPQRRTPQKPKTPEKVDRSRHSPRKSPERVQEYFEDPKETQRRSLKKQKTSEAICNLSKIDEANLIEMDRIYNEQTSISMN